MHNKRARIDRLQITEHMHDIVIPMYDTTLAINAKQFKRLRFKP